MDQSSAQEVPQVDIILLGSPGVGKATFLSRLPNVRPPLPKPRQRPDNSGSSARPSSDGPSVASQTPPAEPLNTVERLSSSNDSQATLLATSDPQADILSNSSQTTLVPPPPPPTPFQPAPLLTGPLSFNVLLFARPYRITIHPSTSPLFIDPFPTSPSLLILTYAIPNRASLHNIRHYWMPQYHLHYPTSTVPIMLLGLQRDLRTAKTITTTTTNEDGSTADRQEYECVMPEEGLQAAREMRLDRYAECSALTGELMWEATQDLTKMAAQTTVDSGDYASEMCVVS